MSVPRTVLDEAFQALRTDLVHEDGPRISTMRNYRYAIVPYQPEDEFKLRQVRDVLTGKLAKRGVDIRALEPGKIEPVSGNKVKEEILVREGVEQERAKNLVKLIKDNKLKVQASIQGNVVRVSGAKKDTLQEAIALVLQSVTDFPLQFKNFRD